MPDISMCCNRDCPIREKCYRYRARPDKYWQSYAFFEYKDDKCDNFWELDVRVDDFLPLKPIDDTFDRDIDKWGGLK